MSTRIRDRYGVEVEAADETAVTVLDEAVHTLVGLEGDPVAAASTAADSGLVLARCLLAYLHCYSGSRRGYALARDVLDGTPDSSAPRERAHRAAARSWASGDLDAAVGHLEQALLRHPRDLLALKIAQDLYLTLGDQVNLRDVAARVLPAWPVGTSGAGFGNGAAADTSDGALVRALVAERVARKPSAGRAAELVIEASQARATRHGSTRHRTTLDFGTARARPVAVPG